MTDMIGKRFQISGMIIEIVSDQGDDWACRNITTNQPLIMQKALVEKAIRLGKAEWMSEGDGQ